MTDLLNYPDVQLDGPSATLIGTGQEDQIEYAERSGIIPFLYIALRRLFELAVLRLRSERTKDLELVVVRHQLEVLRRQVSVLSCVKLTGFPGSSLQSPALPPLGGVLRYSRNPPSLAPAPRGKALEGLKVVFTCSSSPSGILCGIAQVFFRLA